MTGMDRTRTAEQETATMAREDTMKKAMAVTVKNFQGETKLLIGCSHQELPLYHKIF